MVISNDYKVEITSDRQTNRDSQPVFLLIERAQSNIRDNSNQRLLKFDYGLPTANTILGVTLEANKVWGFDFYGEYDFNNQYRQDPNLNLKDHRKAVNDAQAWMFNLSKASYPWFVFLEGYSMDADYSTRTFLAGTRGQDESITKTKYPISTSSSRTTMTKTAGRTGTAIVCCRTMQSFRVLTRNNDFVSDFNQNDTEDRQNFIPDYEEALPALSRR